MKNGLVFLGVFQAGVQRRHNQPGIGVVPPAHLALRCGLAALVLALLVSVQEAAAAPEGQALREGIQIADTDQRANRARVADFIEQPGADRRGGEVVLAAPNKAQVEPVANKDANQNPKNGEQLGVGAPDAEQSSEDVETIQSAVLKTLIGLAIGLVIGGAFRPIPTVPPSRRSKD